MLDVREIGLSAGGADMDCIAFGRGKKPLVMIQGLNTKGIKGSGIMLSLMYRIFAKEYRVYLFDRRADVWDGMTVRDMAADTAAAMDELGITDAYVFGVSLGGMIAQYLAIDRPDLVKRMVLAVTLSRSSPTVEAVINRWIQLTRQGLMKELVRDMAQNMYSERYMKKYRPMLPLLTLLQKPGDTERFIRLAKACLTCEAYEELDKIKCPVMVMGGKNDLIVGAEGSLEIAQRLNCRIHMYDDLGHAAYEEAKDFNKRVYEFFREE